MRKIYFFAAVLILSCTALLSIAYTGENTDSAQEAGGLPAGMEQRSVSNNPGYKIVVPKGTTISKVGDLRVIESSGEYAARKLAEFEQQLGEMNAEIDSLRQEISEIKKKVGLTE